ncbi:hypothetical protein B1A99_09155 [Cohnella sp. CIP 111063]|uniref:hypothetical protein n=1 Tax=unclassified Cohnella TaxID=2636738 RepID=UPI000B8C2D45|nr:MULTISPECIES: hypothetical protein [unclassified Cohnella]OXS59703.1 hypothetical protein B1A99_09155 [Cohnella sp. CIP 111063]PRX72493.1 hypothetical protein B0G52_10546 [Cohnella sp. SGD-V74]
MRKHRSWLMGFGIGLIVGAIMLQMITFAEKQNAPLPQEQMTPEELSDEAKKAGLLLLTQEQLDARVQEAVAASEQEGQGESSGEEGDSGQPDASGEEQTASEAPSATPNSESEEAPPAAEATEQVSLYISYGMSLTEVGQELLKLGVIDDVKVFIEETRPVATKMKVGTAVFKGKPTYQEIMDELVRKK